MMLIKIAWRNLFRQRRRTLITASAIGLSLLIAIPTYGLMEGLTAQMLRGITRMELGQIQIHDPAYPRSKALQSTLRRPRRMLRRLRQTPGVQAAAPRAHGYGLASHETRLQVELVPLDAPVDVRFGRPIAADTPWRQDPALACEAVVRSGQATAQAITVGTVLTPHLARAGDSCERIRISGILARQQPRDEDEAALALYMAREDLRHAFGAPELAGEATLMHSAAVALTGVDPQHERRITFIAEKLTAGRYLGAEPRGEIVVGYRLAKVMRLAAGDRLFVQASTLDYGSNSYYRDFEVIGIYRTGVEMIDRSRVFVHLEDAQQLMGLEGRVHEIAIVGQDARDFDPLLARIRPQVARTRLTVTTSPQGRRAGSAPLPAPVTVFEPTETGGDAELLIPYDLKRRFDQLEGVRVIARRVYARADVALARPLAVDIHQVAAETLPPPARSACHVLLPAEVAAPGSLQEGAILLPGAAERASLDGCPQLVAHVAKPAFESRTPMGDGRGPALLTARQLPDTQRDAPVRVPLGRHELLLSAKPLTLRVAGVEPAYERELSALHTEIAAGRYFSAEGEEARARGAWDATESLLSERAAKRLGARVGTLLLLRGRDDEEQVRWRVVEVVGLLREGTWAAGRPELLLPYFAAQQIDAPRLNARAHEMLLLPADGAAPAQLASRARAELTPLVRSWQQIAPDMAKLLSTQDSWTAVFLLIIFAIAAMTVMNTMLMAVFERTKEFGVLKSIGMRPWQVFSLITLETLSIALVAIAVGGGIGAGLNAYLMSHGLDLSAYTGGFTYQGTFIDPVWRSVVTMRSIATPSLMVGLVCLLVSLYPAMRAGRLQPVRALRDRG